MVTKYVIEFLPRQADCWQPRGFGVKRELQVRFPNSFVLLSSDGPFDRDRFGALDDRCDDRAADQITAVKSLFATAAQGHFQKFIFITAGELPVNKSLDQAFDRR